MMENEPGYLNLIRQVLTTKRLRPNRTGIPTLSVFGAQLTFNLANKTLPLLTTKHVSFHNIATELLWFLRGDTNQKHLEQHNVNIWQGNSSRSYLDSKGLYAYKEHESLGPIYGFQWRHFGATYTSCHADYTNCGYDQLKRLERLIKTNPTDRTMVMSAWNPLDIDKMVLPPCHVLVQFEVDPDLSTLSAHMYQRSADLMLGVPYNIASYALFTHIMAHKCKLTADKLVCSYGNVHIYQPHVEGATLQIQRVPTAPPSIQMLFPCDLDYNQLRVAHFKVNNYIAQQSVPFTMVV